MKKDAVPLMGTSVGFTSTSCVVHPPPSAKCGKYNVSFDAGVAATALRYDENRTAECKHR